MGDRFLFPLFARKSTTLKLLAASFIITLIGTGADAQDIVTPLETSPPVTQEVKHNDEWEPILRTVNDVPMALVPAGCFMMGSDEGPQNEHPAHEQCFESPFWIDRFEVTNAQFTTFNGRAEHDSYWTADDRPRDSINWFEAHDYCVRRGARLPTEAEWEYAARGPDGLVYPWGNTFITDNVTYEANSQAESAPVGQRPENISWVGAYDMVGNVHEWTSSMFVEEWGQWIYPYSPDDGRENALDTLHKRVFRGGGWGTNAFGVVASRRETELPTYYAFSIGFRCVQDFRPSDLTQKTEP